ncbi:MAG TPA: thiol:disulfide interchange protein DsbA/DsbL [Steroidobacteraceae bacterium]|jgi:thiol:disulfide interchange protein DsbA|nr:thiol:disulfide interchange protein DsbA/DsbL [Steroidobacteraceae bacterium]
MKRYLTLIVLALSLAACARASGPSAAPATASTDAANTAAEAPAAAPAASATAAPVSAGDLAAQAKQEQEGTDSGTTDSSEVSLERVAALPAAGRLPAGKWIPGTNYTVLLPAQPSDAPPGQVQVVEMFWYGCPHCYALDPFLTSWLKTKPAYIDFVRVPVMWGDVHRAHARLFYTLMALGKLDALHTKVFDEIHQKGDELYVQGDPKTTLQSQLRFAEANGISAAAFTNAYDSFGVQTDLQKADALGRRYQIDSVPTIVIDGKYKTDVGMAGGEAQLIELINDLAASEKHTSG